MEPQNVTSNTMNKTHHLPRFLFFLVLEDRRLGIPLQRGRAQGRRRQTRRQPLVGGAEGRHVLRRDPCRPLLNEVVQAPPTMSDWMQTRIIPKAK